MLDFPSVKSQFSTHQIMDGLVKSEKFLFTNVLGFKYLSSRGVFIHNAL
jgi:hypothetical protein